MCNLHLEGMISKDVDTTYQQKRSNAWLKVICKQGQEFLILGFTESKNLDYEFGALVLEYYDGDGKLKYASKVSTGFSHKKFANLLSKMKRVKMD